MPIYVKFAHSEQYVEILAVLCTRFLRSGYSHDTELDNLQILADAESSVNRLVVVVKSV